MSKKTNNEDTVKALQNENILLKEKLADLESIQKKYDKLSTQINDLTSTIPGAVYQFEVYDDNTYHISFMSKSAESIYEAPYEKLLDMDYLTQRVTDEDRPQFLQSIAEAVREKKPWSNEFRIVVKDGKTKWIHGISNPSKINNVWNGVLMDITDHKAIEFALALNDERYRKAQEIGHVGNWEYNLETQSFWGSEEARKIFAFPEDIIDLSTDMVENCIPERERVHQALVDLIVEDKPYDIVYEIKSMTKGERKVINSQAEVLRDDNGNPLKIIGVVQDITTRYYAELELKKSLQEKETLLRELYHRTKNNMQVITSILAMQALRSNDEKVASIVNDTNGKIKAIALVHQKLYQSKNLSSIDLKNYFEELLEIILKSYSNKEDIEIESDLDSFNVVIDIAIPCGLMLNELVTNSMKHAFTDHKKGTIYIRLKRTNDGMIDLTYKDNGKGAPEGFDFKNADTLGLQTIVSIGEHQLSGNVHFENTPGVSCTITFPETMYHARV